VIATPTLMLLFSTFLFSPPLFYFGSIYFIFFIIPLFLSCIYKGLYKGFDICNKREHELLEGEKLRRGRERG
jgi:hypothetical protein